MMAIGSSCSVARSRASQRVARVSRPKFWDREMLQAFSDAAKWAEGFEIELFHNDCDAAHFDDGPVDRPLFIVEAWRDAFREIMLFYMDDGHRTELGCVLDGSMHIEINRQDERTGVLLWRRSSDVDAHKCTTAERYLQASDELRSDCLAMSGMQVRKKLG
ncbi:hypothetical protein MRB53_037130 [Persea americana]|nr:hypothetical protein MRB53_037130 [Persea americana]